MNRPTLTEDDYFGRDEELYAAADTLRVATAPSVRAAALRTVADIDRVRASMHEAVFGPAEDDEVPAAEWMGDSARLAAILAETEWRRPETVIGLNTSEWFATGWGHEQRTQDLAVAARPVLTMWAAGEDRTALVGELTETWLAMTRGQAVEVIACLGVPRAAGKVGPRSVLASIARRVVRPVGRAVGTLVGAVSPGPIITDDPHGMVCDGCLGPVDLRERHIVVLQQVEVLRWYGIKTVASEVRARVHLGCAAESGAS